MARIRNVVIPLIAVYSLVLTACSGGGSGEAGSTAGSGCDTSAGCGTVLVAVTDADGDFTSYTVDVLSIELERADGATVETLPATTRVDFAALTDLSELISAATLAPADIAAGHIRLDYSNAEIYVETGGEIVPATVVDTTGDPLGVVDVEIRFDDRDRLVVTRGRTQLLQIDFDLSASHTLDTSTTPVTATAEPFLVAEARPVDEKELRVRGTLRDVDTSNATYDVRLRPWHERAGDHGTVTVATLPTTEFEIDGIAYVGQEGIDALALLPTGTLTVAFGTLDLTDRRFTATIVHAGSSVAGDLLAAVDGSVVARSGDTLVVRGATAVRRDDDAGFERMVIVEVGADTGVSRLGDAAGTYGKDDLSVGQHIVAFGTLTEPGTTAADAAPVLNATAGRVRMLPTRLRGTVNSVVPGQINLSLSAIDRLGIDQFDFSGTGTSTDSDADPADYEVATATLELDSVETADAIGVVGFVEPFGAAPPDFEGRTIVGPRTLRAALGVGYGDSGTASPFTVMTVSSLVVDITNPDIGLRHHLLLGGMSIDLLGLPASPSLEPASGRTVFGIGEDGHVELFADFADFVDELAVRLGAGETVRSLAAYGTWNSGTNVLTADRVFVQVLPAP